MSIIYTKEVGQKFNEDGTFRYFPGNTVICPLTDQFDLVNCLSWVQEKFKALPFSEKFVFLPVDSFHMTAFDLVCEQVLNKNDSWPQLVEKKELKEVDAYFYKAIQKIDHPTILMKYNGVSVNRIKLIPATKEDEDLLIQYREEVARVTGVEYSNHYQFHISLSYFKIELTNDEKEMVQILEHHMHQELKRQLSTIHVGKPIFTIFNDMSSFVTYDRGRDNLGSYK